MLSMEQFQESLGLIREKEYDRKKQNEFNQWQVDYDEHLQELYKITCRYYVVEYHDFVKMMYKTTASSRRHLSGNNTFRVSEQQV